MSDLMRPDLTAGFAQAVLDLQSLCDKLDLIPLDSLLEIAQEAPPDMDTDGHVPKFIQAAIALRDEAKAYSQFQKRFFAERMQRESS